jgi:hypothetical protein
MKNKNYLNKSGLSTVVSVLLIILLTMAAIAIVWTFVRNMVNENKDQVESCFKVESSEMVTLNGLYTCYDTTTIPDNIQFSINIGDVEIDSLVVSIMYAGSSESVILTNEPIAITTLKPYGGAFNQPVSLPGKNSGKTYALRVEDELTGIDWIKIAPIINDNQCGVTDQIYDVSDCSLIVT